MSEQTRQAAIKAEGSKRVYASYTWSVRLKYLREASNWFWQYLSGTTMPEDKLTELTTIYRAWSFAEAIRAEQNRLILDTNLTVADGVWPVKTDYDSAQLPSVWTDGIDLSRLDGLSTLIDARIQWAIGTSLTDVQALQDAVTSLQGNTDLITALQAAGLQSAAINGSGHLILTKNDNSTINAGVVVGPQGDTGAGIQSVAINGSGHLIVTFSDDSQQDAGSAIGPKGDTGNQGNVGVRGSKFLGAYANQASLPSIDNSAVIVGDYAYLSDVGELWRAA